MRMNVKHCVWVLALAVGLGGGTLQLMGAPQDHQDSNNKTEQQTERQPDYSKNKTYQQGMREGQYDHARNLDHSKKRHFKKDGDQKAYEAGYVQGHDNR